MRDRLQAFKEWIDLPFIYNVTLLILGGNLCFRHGGWAGLIGGGMLGLFVGRVTPGRR
jgi:hypothetical protein